MIYLSILDLNQAKEIKDETFLENISKGRDKLKKSYKANYKNPVVALQLADYCFNKKEYDKVKNYLEYIYIILFCIKLIYKIIIIIIRLNFLLI